jgi:hypothetical protein
MRFRRTEVYPSIVVLPPAQIAQAISIENRNLKCTPSERIRMSWRNAGRGDIRAGVEAIGITVVAEIESGLPIDQELSQRRTS